MNDIPPARPLSADEIRAILDFLGLSRAEAGQILGGGRKAFYPYLYPEGDPRRIEPSQPMCQLLRLLVSRPSGVDLLRRGIDIDIEQLRQRTESRTESISRTGTAIARIAARAAPRPKAAKSRSIP